MTTNRGQRGREDFTPGILRCGAYRIRKDPSSPATAVSFWGSLRRGGARAGQIACPAPTAESHLTTYAPSVLATRLVRRTWVSTALLIVGGALLTAAAAQVSFYIPPVPVPFTMQTFVVLLCGGVLGSRAGAASQLLYVAMGAAGLPFFAEASSGFDVLVGPTAGYLFGFIVAAFVVGKLAERGDDRHFVPAVGVFLIGSLIIYACGVAGLMLAAEMSFGDAVANGVLPFVFWDVLKALAAGALLPGVWKLVGEKRS